MADLARFQNEQRVDQNDMEFVADDTPQALMRQVPAQFLTNPNGSQLWIIDGFGITNPALKQCRVTLGRALLGMREDGQVQYGMLAHEGDATRTLDLAGYANGTYTVWLRFQFNDGDFGNRIFWNATTLAEYAQSIATRRTAAWSFRVDLTSAGSPGAEWFALGEVVVSGAATLTVTNERQFYFEGDEGDLYSARKSDGAVWGGGNDRAADRATYGVKDLQTFTAAMRVQLEYIFGVGSQRWYETPPKGLVDKLSLSGGTLTGPVETNGSTFSPAVTGTGSLGLTLQRWAAAFINALTIATSLTFDAASRVIGNILPNGAAQKLGSTGANEQWNLHAAIATIYSGIATDGTTRSIGGAGAGARFNAYLENAACYEPLLMEATGVDGVTQKNLISRRNVSAVTGTLVCIGDGSVGVLGGHNILSAALVGGDPETIEVTLTNALGSSYYAPNISSMKNGAMVQQSHAVQVISTTVFRVKIYDAGFAVNHTGGNIWAIQILLNCPFA